MVLVGLLINNAFAKTINLSNFNLKEDTTLLLLDSLNKDSLIDSDISANAPKFKVKYTAKDSIDFDNANQIVYLYGEAKVEYDNVTEFDLTLAGSTWFSVESEAKYGVGKSLPGGEYKANVVAECIAD